MRSTRGASSPRLRRDPWTAWFAALLLLFQVVLAADHLGASAASAFGSPPDDIAVGLLSLCHGDGSTVVADADADDRPSSGAPVPPCVLCASMAITGASVQATAPAIVEPAERVIDVVRHVAVEAAPRPPILRYGTERGPPSSSLV